MNVFRHVHDRQLEAKRGLGKIPLEFSLPKLKCETIDMVPGLPFGVTYDPIMSMSYLDEFLLVTTEGGFVIINSVECGKPLKPMVRWGAHHNAAFDAKWRPGFGHRQIVTVSGDQSFALWDMLRLDGSHTDPIFRQSNAHLSTIRTISFQDANVFATGSRDGSISLWDLRSSSPSHSLQKVSSISDAHVAHSIGSSIKRPGRSGIKCIRSSPLSSVTSLLFRPRSHQLFSAGASDGAIKMWDIRQLKKQRIPVVKSKAASAKSSIVQPVKTFTYSGNKSFTSGHGFSHLAFDSNEQRIFSSCSDHRIYAYDTFTSDLVASFSGPSFRTNNFTRIKIINNLLVSGSVEGSVPIWSLRDVKFTDRMRRIDIKPRVMLSHHEEVTAVEGNESTNEIYSCSDDQRIHRWSLFGGRRSTSEDDNNPPNLKPFVQVYDCSHQEEVLLEEIVEKKEIPKGSPLMTLTGWLASGDTSANSQVVSPSKRKRLITQRKENTDDNNQHTSTPPSQTLVNKRRVATEVPKKKKRRALFTPQSNKISDYFH